MLLLDYVPVKGTVAALPRRLHIVATGSKADEEEEAIAEIGSAAYVSSSVAAGRRRGWFQWGELGDCYYCFTTSPWKGQT